MFGIAVARLDQVSKQEKARYEELYCGLCRALKDRYGQTSRAALNYDLAFYVMLCDSLHEPVEQTGAERCPSHPRKPQPFARSKWSDYAADLTVALAYHKCLDDVADEGSVRGHAGAAALAGAYKKAQERIPEECAAIEAAMQEIRGLEAGGAETPPDAAAKVFGQLLGQIFAHDQGIWTGAMRAFGENLGYFIYLMDAAVDAPEDKKSESYNPFVLLSSSPEEMRTILEVAIGNATAIFEKLPLEQDLHLMRSVLYSGVWQKFNRVYEKNAEQEQRARKGRNARHGYTQIKDAGE